MKRLYLRVMRWIALRFFVKKQETRLADLGIHNREQARSAGIRRERQRPRMAVPKGKR